MFASGELTVCRRQTCAPKSFYISNTPTTEGIGYIIALSVFRKSALFNYPIYFAFISFFVWLCTANIVIWCRHRSDNKIWYRYKKCVERLLGAFNFGSDTIGRGIFIAGACLPDKLRSNNTKALTIGWFPARRKRFFIYFCVFPEEYKVILPSLRFSKRDARPR